MTIFLEFEQCCLLILIMDEKSLYDTNYKSDSNYTTSQIHYRPRHNLPIKSWKRPAMPKTAKNDHWKET